MPHSLATAVLGALTVALAVLSQLRPHSLTAGALLAGAVILLVLHIGIFGGQLTLWATT